VLRSAVYPDNVHAPDSRFSGAIRMERPAAEVEQSDSGAGGDGGAQKVYMLWEVIGGGSSDHL
jgi:hypothetical protein